jgi:hypothetical protein
MGQKQPDLANSRVEVPAEQSGELAPGKRRSGDLPQEVVEEEGLCDPHDTVRGENLNFQLLSQDTSGTTGDPLDTIVWVLS